MENTIKWFALSVRSGKQGVPANSINNIKEKIINDPLFGIYKIKVYLEGTVTPEILLYAESSKRYPDKLSENVERFIKSDLVGAASYRVFKGKVPESQADINAVNTRNFKELLSGKEIMPIKKDQLIEDINKENIRIAEIATAHIKTISFDEQREPFLVVDIGYVNGLIKQDKYNSILGEEVSFRNQASDVEKSMGLSTNSIDIVSVPISKEERVPLPEGMNYIKQEQLLKYIDIIENKAKNIAKELWEQQRQIESSYKKFVQEDIIRKYSIGEEEVSQQDAEQIRVPESVDTTIYEEDLKEESKEEVMVPKFEIVDYGINFGKVGNIKLHLAVHVEGVTDEPEVAVIDMGQEEFEKPIIQRQPQTLEKLITPKGFSYISNELNTIMNNHIGVVSETSWMGKVIDKSVDYSSDWNSISYFYLREINTGMI